MKGYNMKNIKNIKWYNKLIIIGSLLLLTINPLSLIFISSGIEIAVQMIGNALQSGITIAIEYIYIPMGLGAVLIFLGIGASMGANEKNNIAKLKSMKNKPTNKAGKYLEI